jgi:hypothetical protein
MILSIVPTVMLLNYLLFGSRYFSEVHVFLLATPVLFLCSFATHQLYIGIISRLRDRFPDERKATIRITLSIGSFVLLSGLLLLLLFRVYSFTRFLDFQPIEGQFAQCYSVVIVVNAFFTFVYEAMANLDHYVRNTKATEELKKEYLQSQLLGLRSQMNPHFLFNSLNTLSSLIHEDADEAEAFLDHMSKVFRYLLRHQDDKEVPLKKELDFLQSYYFLLKARHTEGLHLQIDVPDTVLNCSIPPMTLQMLVENIISQQSLSRQEPLQLFVEAHKNGLRIRHNWQPRQMNDATGDKVLENIRNKFKLLHAADITDYISANERAIVLPLIASPMPAAV